MESLGRFWYYLKATQGPHCCVSNFRTTENSYRGRDIWREVPWFNAEPGLTYIRQILCAFVLAWHRPQLFWPTPLMALQLGKMAAFSKTRQVGIVSPIYTSYPLKDKVTWWLNFQKGRLGKAFSKIVGPLPRIHSRNSFWILKKSWRGTRWGCFKL